MKAKKMAGGGAAPGNGGMPMMPVQGAGGAPAGAGGPPAGVGNAGGAMRGLDRAAAMSGRTMPTPGGPGGAPMGPPAGAPMSGPPGGMPAMAMGARPPMPGTGIAALPPVGASSGMKKGGKVKFTAASDDAYDKRNGIEEGSKQDLELDKKRGIKDDGPAMKKGGKMPPQFTKKSPASLRGSAVPADANMFSGAPAAPDTDSDGMKRGGKAKMKGGGSAKKYAKGGSVKGWGLARGGRSAKMC